MTRFYRNGDLTRLGAVLLFLTINLLLRLWK